jgi:hypothetical protein
MHDQRGCPFTVVSVVVQDASLNNFGLMGRSKTRGVSDFAAILSEPRRETARTLTNPYFALRHPSRTSKINLTHPNVNVQKGADMWPQRRCRHPWMQRRSSPPMRSFRDGPPAPKRARRPRRVPAASGQSYARPRRRRRAACPAYAARGTPGRTPSRA